MSLWLTACHGEPSPRPNKITAGETGWRDWLPVSRHGYWRLERLTLALSKSARRPSKVATSEVRQTRTAPTRRRANGPNTWEWSDSEREAITNLNLTCRRRENEATRNERPRHGGDHELESEALMNLKLDRNGRWHDKDRRPLRLSWATRMWLGYDGLRPATARLTCRGQWRRGHLPCWIRINR